MTGEPVRAVLFELSVLRLRYEEHHSLVHITSTTTPILAPESTHM